ncbi:MAG: hypothetical protein HKN76_06445 [Saprospiraceae bacterium]|nr:hypothetical protein [Saprospiraceae bacterium]
MIINLISCPRTISTAMMYAFAQRKDMAVLDEPFYAVYLHKTQLDHPGREDILNSLPEKEEEVVSNILRRASRSHVFVKNMASHYEVLDPSLLKDSQTVFLIRDPLRIIASYSKVIHAPTQQDIGVLQQAKLFRWYKAHGVHSPIVIDSNDMLVDPEQHLRSLCHYLDLEFDHAMLSWPKGPKSYDGVWASHWYSKVHSSVGFSKQSISQDDLPNKFQALYKDCRVEYDFLYSHSITNRNATRVSSQK